MVALIMGVVLFVLWGQNVLTVKPAGDVRNYFMLGGWIMLAVAAVAFLIALLISWLIYRNYTFCLEDDALKIRRGVITKEEIAIPYRQIQDINIERSLDYQALGMSRIVILTAGHEDEPHPEGEAEGILPGLDKDFAEALQTELLKRTSVERVTEILTAK
jgi:putative membrane protein